MKILNWFSSNKNGSPSTTGRGGKITVAKALAFAKEAEKLGKFYVFLKHYIDFLLSTEREIATQVKAIQEKTNQNLKGDQLIKELRILRYAATHVWFFDIKVPKNQNEVKENLSLINHAFQNILENHGKTSYLSWLKNGFSEYAGVDELNFSNLKSFKNNFSEKLAEKVSQIAFDCTEGRLAGELHDFVIELIMTIVQKDQKAFQLDDNVSLTDKETGNIRNTIDSMKPTEKDFEDFINFLG
ncbi:MAG: hypothetical protein US76_00290 [Parcubacteria group bacterium GW2011_GWA2_38_13b]|nr:MAG: hypothetical protein US76_00290 [Parcubacteria group bacterium GW2011_GWA2_38_13b]